MQHWLNPPEKYAEVVRYEHAMHAYQDMAADFLFDNPFSALFVDTGLGKTVIVLTLLVRLLLAMAIKKVLIVAPVRVAAETWPTEIRAWDHTAFLNFTVIRAEDDHPDVIAAGQAATEAFKLRPDYAEKMAEHRRLRALKADEMLFATTKDERKAVKVMKTGETPQTAAQKARTAMKRRLRERYARSTTSIHIINREALEWLVAFWGDAWPYDVMIIDESSSVKDHTTGRFKAVNKVRRKLVRLHELTATPAAESYMGLFAQTYLLDLGERFGRTITAWRQRYFDYNPYSRVYKLRPGAQKKISSKMADICLVMQSKDYLDEIEPLFLTRKLHMLPYELKAYRDFERDFVFTLPSGEEIEAETASALSGKLLQLASGAVYTATKETRLVHDHKIEDLAQLAEELAEAGEPLMVAYWYKSSLARLKKQFPKAVVMDKGGKAVKPWNAGKIPMLLVHPASVGHGLNLQYGPGHDLYMFDLCWSYELYYQLYRRLHRQGQTKQVRVHLPQMVGTNDELVADRLLMKEDAQEALFNHIKKLRLLWAARRKIDQNYKFKIAA